VEAEIQSRTVLLEQANKKLQRQKEIQELLKELSQDITRLDVDSLLKKLTERVREVFKVDISDVRVLTDEGLWKVMGISGAAPSETQSDSTATAGGRSRWILDNRRPLLIHDITKTNQFSGGESIRKVGVRGYIGVPIFSRGGDVIGILRALTYRPREASPEEVDLLQLMANGTGIALENAKLLEHIRQQAQTLEQANRQQADFTAMIAHDLRSPLTNVIGIAEMMKDDLLGPVNEDQKKWR
jgi:GAF domain-containing protein